MEKFWVVFSPAFHNKARKCATFELAVEKSKEYAESIPGSKFYVCESVGGFEHEVTDFEINQIVIEE